MLNFITTWVAIWAVVYLVLVGLAWSGLLGERAHRHMTELNETGKRKLLLRRLRDADERSTAAYVEARSAMNRAAGHDWRNLSEWRDG